MKISQIINLNNAQNVKIARTVNPYLPQGLNADTFEKISFKGTFNLDETVKELTEMKGLKDRPKFDAEKLAIVTAELQKAPEKWEPFRDMIQNPKILGSIACEIIKKSSKEVASISELACMKTGESPRFTPFDIKAISNELKGTNFDKAKILAKSNLRIDDFIALSKNSRLSNPEKVVEKVNSMEAKCGEKLLSLSFKTDAYDPNSFALIADLQDTSKKIELFDKDMNTISSEEVQAQNHPSGKQYQIKKTIDYRNNTTSKVRLEVSKRLPQPIVLNEIRVIKDENGKIQRKEYTEQSEVTGVLNIKHIFPDGSEKILSSGSVNPKTGITTVKKDMTSLDGTHTQYLYEDDPKGNRIIDYVISDKDENVLLKNSQSFEVISDNKFLSAKNNETYEITVNKKEINIKDMTKNTEAKIEFENYIGGNKEKVIEALKRLPGEELIAMSKTVKHLNGIDDIISSTYGATNKRIKTGNNLFVMLHELGHAKDYEKVDVSQQETFVKSIFSNPKVNATFEQEKALFNKEFPNAQREHINYFIKTSDVKDGIQEVIAETNALLNTYNNDDLFSIRAQYLQQYFPKTIANLSQVLNK